MKILVNWNNEDFEYDLINSNKKNIKEYFLNVLKKERRKLTNNLKKEFDSLFENEICIDKINLFFKNNLKNKDLVNIYNKHIININEKQFGESLVLIQNLNKKEIKLFSICEFLSKLEELNIIKDGDFNSEIKEKCEDFCFEKWLLNIDFENQDDLNRNMILFFSEIEPIMMNKNILFDYYFNLKINDIY